MKALTSAGRFFFVVPFLVFGLLHIFNTNAMASMVLAGWPMANILVIISGIGFLAAALSIVTGVKARLACFLLALLLLIIILTVHLPGMLNESTRQMAMPGFLKDTGLMGAALSYAGIFNQ